MTSLYFSRICSESEKFSQANVRALQSCAAQRRGSYRVYEQAAQTTTGIGDFRCRDC